MPGKLFRIARGVDGATDVPRCARRACIDASRFLKLLLQKMFLHLAKCVARQRCSKNDPTRFFVTRQARAAPVDQFLFQPVVRLRCRHNHRHHLFTKLRVGQPDTATSATAGWSSSTSSTSRG
jgi:hypothetical protein